MSPLKRKSIAASIVAALAADSFAALSLNVEPNGWPNATHRNAAVTSLQAVVNRYNAYGDFGNYSVYAYYNAGIPTAQASYLGSIGYGGTYPNERVTQHESNHYLGSGTIGEWDARFNGNVWTGAKVNRLFAQFDGDGAVMLKSGVHFYPYGLNYDSEVTSDAIYMRNIAIMYAMRQDMGIGNANNPWTATNVALAASDPAGKSAFNWFGGGLSNASYQGWNDKYFAHPDAAYSTGAFDIRTPEGYPSWTFQGDSLTVNAGGRLLFNGYGTDGTVSVKKLVVDNGTIRHDQFAQDLFQLAGDLELRNSPVIDAANGSINIKSAISGTGSLSKSGGKTLTLSAANTYTGATNINAGTLRLAPASLVASYTFDNVTGSTVVNEGSGGAGMNGTLANGATIVAAGGGRSGNALSVSNGASVDINNFVADLSNNKNWAVSAWVKTTTAGGSILTKSNGGWDDGDTVFYLGDGTAGGSGGTPSGVRYGGGFFQTASNATPVNDGTWHQVTYVSSGNGYAIYTDGVVQTLSAGNGGFGNLDLSSIVRLGVSTNTIAGDGTLNFNGLLDNVQFYGQSLSAAQVAAIYQGKKLGTLPVTTNVSIAGGATLDLNHTVQQIGSLSGANGSAVRLGSGQLIVDSPANTTFAGSIGGTGGSLVKNGSGTLTLSGANSYTGATTIGGGTLRLASAGNTIASGAVASYTFETANGGATPNAGLGGAAMNGNLAGGATIVAGGHTGNAVSLANGASVNIANPITDLSNLNDWTVTAWMKTVTPGGSLLTKGNGSSWANGNTIFYLGDGSAGGSGGIPSAVRYAGGFLQGAPGSASITNGAWHQVTYVNTGGVYQIYVDGVAQPLSSGNAGFSNADVGTIVRLGVSTNSVAGDGTLNFNGLLDDVQFYGRALSADQISALYQGLNLGPLPVTTDVSIASGATLDVNGVVQEIATLSGPTGSVVTLGTGRLIVNSSINTQFAGAISGIGGSLVKRGTNTFTLSGPGTYTGETVIQGGTLVVTSAAQSAILDAGSAGADIQAGRLVFDYAGGTTPAPDVLAILDAGYDQTPKFSSGRLRDTVLQAGHVLGWRDDAAAQTVVVLPTLPGDSNLDLAVNFDDLLILAQNYDANASGKVWAQGDGNYDGVVNFDDLLTLAQNYGLNAYLSGDSPLSGEVFLADWNLARSLVPEPVGLPGVIAVAVKMVWRRRRD